MSERNVHFFRYETNHFCLFPLNTVNGGWMRGGWRVDEGWIKGWIKGEWRVDEGGWRVDEGWIKSGWRVDERYLLWCACYVSWPGETWACRFLLPVCSPSSAQRLAGVTLSWIAPIYRSYYDIKEENAILVVFVIGNLQLKLWIFISVWR